MSVHQIIYTSCMRGINSVNDGQQVFSYDAQFKDYNNDDVKSLFSYQPPALEPGVVMTEEIAATLPRAFIYRNFEDGRCAISLNTYLGRDYMGSAGRFGNHLSHVVVADKIDMVNYPCEFYGSSVLRERMEFEEVNNPNPPEFLPVPSLKKGYAVDAESVLEFLGIGERLEIYKNMLYAMLAFERERKRVIICDAAENIIMWIAALEYAVPLKNALNINFTTYEFDPALSAAQICGVVKKGTRYTSDSKRLHFVFDIEENECVEFEKEAEFYDFIDTAFSLSFESLQDFHVFLEQGYTYDKVDEEYYSAYTLYSLISDGVSGVTQNRVDAALRFADRYAVSTEKVKIAKNLLSQSKALYGINKESFLVIIRYIFSVKNALDGKEQMIIRDAIVERILGEFFYPENAEEVFLKFYNDTDRICREHNFGLASELMQDNNREKLFAAMQSSVHPWKINFIIRVVSTYVKECNIPVSELTPDKPLGYLYYGIINAVYLQNPQNGYFLISCILNEFACNGAVLTNMALNVEGMLLDVPNGVKETAVLWNIYGQIMAAYQKKEFLDAYNIFAYYKRHEQVYMLFQLQLQNSKDIQTAQDVFGEHFNGFVQMDREYALQYEQLVLQLYFNKLGEFDRGQSRTAKIIFLDLLVQCGIDVGFADELIVDLIRNVPYESPTRKNLELVQNAVKYIYDFERKPITGKLLLLEVGMTIESIKTRGRLTEKMNQIKMLAQSKRIHLTEMPKNYVEEYFSWVLPNACRLCRKNDEMNMFYDLFDMSSSVEKYYFSMCTRLYLKQCKDEKDYGVFAEYFGFACRYSTSLIREEIGKSLCKLNKNKLAELDDIICETYGTDKEIIRCWNDVREIAELTNPLLNNLSNLFRIRKK